MTTFWPSLLLIASMAILSLTDAYLDARENRSVRTQRWPANIALTLINAGLVSVFPIGTFTAALAAEELGWKPFGLASIPFAFSLLLTAIALSAINYALHRAFHAVPALWALHSVHHSDPQPDSTTALRHHPLEVIITATAASPVVFGLGLSPLAVATIVLIDLAFAIWTHAEDRLPRRLTNAASWIIVTPALHRIHHSDDQHETDTNFGTTFSIWDRLFGTFLADPLRAKADFRTGLEEVSAEEANNLDALLTGPLKQIRARPNGP